MLASSNESFKKNRLSNESIPLKIHFYIVANIKIKR